MSASEVLLAVTAIWLVAVISPGPNTLVLAHVAVSGGRRVATRTTLGILCATFLWCLAAWVGFQALLQAAPGLLIAMKALGGAYLCYLGLRLIWLSRRHGRSIAPTAGAAEPSRYPRPWRLGFLTNASNPKTVAFLASVFLTAFPGDAPIWLGLAAVAIILSISAAYYCVLIALLSRPRAVRAYGRARAWIDRVAGAVFVAFGVKLASD